MLATLNEKNCVYNPCEVKLISSHLSYFNGADVTEH